MTESETKDFTSTNRRISRLDWPTQEHLLAARRERGLLLLALIAVVARKGSRAFAIGQQHRNVAIAKATAARAG